MKIERNSRKRFGSIVVLEMKIERNSRNRLASLLEQRDGAIFIFGVASLVILQDDVLIFYLVGLTLDL